MDYISPVIDSYIRTKALEHINKKFKAKAKHLEIINIDPVTNATIFKNVNGEVIVDLQQEIGYEYEKFCRQLRTRIYEKINEDIFKYLKTV